MKLNELPNGHIVRVAPNIVFVKNITHKDACELEGKTLRPNEVQKLFLKEFSLKDKTTKIRSLIHTHGVYLGVALASREPFAEYIKDGNLYVSAQYGSETREYLTPVDNLITAGIDSKKLEKGNQILYTLDFYGIEKTPAHTAYKVTGAKTGSILLQDWLSTETWRESENGLVSTKCSDAEQRTNLYNQESVPETGILLGSIRRGYSNFMSEYSVRVIVIGASPHNFDGVFKKTTGTSLDMRKSVPDLKNHLLKKLDNLETTFRNELYELRQLIENL